MKKILLILTISATILSCSKVKKGEFLIEGTAKGIADGKTVILQKPDEMMGLVALDTVKIKDGKFEIKGKIEEPAIYTLQIQDAQGQIPVIVENEAVTVAVDKDSIQNSKVGGSYNNEEFTKFNQDMKVAQKTFVAQDKAFREKNKADIASLQTNQDPEILARLNAEYSKIQEGAQKVSKERMTTYADSHPKSFISVLIIEGMFKSPDVDFEKAKKMYNNLEEDLKKTKAGKSIKTIIDGYKKPQPTVGPQPTNTAPQAAQ